MTLNLKFARIKWSFVVVGLCCFYSTSAQITYVGYGQKNVKAPYLVEGKVTSAATGEPLIGANIILERQNQGTSTDPEGWYSFKLYKGTYRISVTSVGYKPVMKVLDVHGPGRVNFVLIENITELDEFVLQTQNIDKNVTSKELGKNVLTIESLKTLPPLAGEVDILKSLTLLPGVSTVGETSGGFNVRGGGSDQNLILLGGATLYNPSHLFGFFSSFNASVVRDVALYKGTVPPVYGGRGSSVVDVAYKKGNFGSWIGDISLGMLSSKFSAGGPIIPGKLSMITAARTAYPNWILKYSNDPNITNSSASFFDTNLILNYIINEKNDLEYSFYLSGDKFRFADNTSNEWSNLSQVIRWNSTISDQLSLHIAGISTLYNSHIISDVAFGDFDLESKIMDNQIDAGLAYQPKKNQTFKFGAQIKFMEIGLGTLTSSPDSSFEPESIEPENAIESGIYFQHEFDLNKKLGFSYGIRYSNFRFLGPESINTYDPNLTKNEISITGKQEFGGGELIQSYDGLEPRASLKYQLNDKTSIKIGYNRINQYIHLISNTIAIAPTDIWKLSDSFIKPQVVTQYSIGLFRNLRNNRIEISLEGYYKELENTVEYKDGADFFLNSHLETELIAGRGESYGLEFYLNKKRGRLNGWLSYTYSRSLRRINGRFEEEILNNGSLFPSNFDRPHDFTAVSIYRLGQHTTLSGIFTFSSGRPVTLPEGKFQYNGIDVAFFDDRNNERAPSYHRLDVSLQFRIPSKKKIWDGTWTLSIYNLYARKNPFSVFFQDVEGSPPQAYKLSVVGTLFPAVSYEIKF